jgi:hypothetical protein
MMITTPARSISRTARLRHLAATAVVSVAVLGAAGPNSFAAPNAASIPPALTHAAPVTTPALLAQEAEETQPRQRRQPRRPPPGEGRPGGIPAGPGEADGVLPDGVTIFDDAYPGVANIDPDLLLALRAAAGDAAGDGLTFIATSGWRTPAYQEDLLREAIAVYGSETEAARWVATPSTSAHVSGDAVDLGPYDVTAWLATHGANYGLCQIYGNEPWHFELRPDAIGHGCPPMFADPTDDPRVQP